MRLIVRNTKTECVVGGKDNLLDIDLLKELRKYLRVRPENYSMNTAYRKGHWDGWQYFITPKGKFATGLLKMVYDYLIELGAEVIIDDRRINLPTLSEPLSDYVGCIDGVDWVARPEQIEMVQKVNNYLPFVEPFYFPRGVLDCATNAGKTSMAALVVNNLPKGTKIVFVVSSKIIYKQALEFFGQVCEGSVGEVRSGKIDFQDFTVCMVKSLGNAIKKDLHIKTILAKVEVCIVDESDEAGAKGYSTVLSHINAGMRVFLSGTPMDSPNKVSKMIQVGLSGTILGRITKRQLIDLGRSQEPIISILLNTSPPANYPTYVDEKYANIHVSKGRVELIASTIEKKHLDKPIIITFTELAHGEFMMEYLEKRFPTLTIGILHGGLPNLEREDLLDDYKRGRVDIMLCSMVIKRGANIPNIRVLFLAQGGKSKTTLKQLSGRGERHDGKNDSFYLYDFYDTGRWVSKHSELRIKTYISEEMKVSFNYPADMRYKPL